MVEKRRSGNGSACRDNMDCAVRFELHHTVALGKQGKIIASSDKKSGPESAAALADDDAAGGHKLASVGFHAQPFRIGITAVGGTALCFCMRHGEFPLNYFAALISFT